jgi:hypothetical protein
VAPHAWGRRDPCKGRCTAHFTVSSRFSGSVSLTCAPARA